MGKKKVINIMKEEEINKKIAEVNKKISNTRSHLARIELEKKLSDLLEMKATRKTKKELEM